jgi:hypothetical protein
VLSYFVKKKSSLPFVGDCSRVICRVEWESPDCFSLNLFDDDEKGKKIKRTRTSYIKTTSRENKIETPMLRKISLSFSLCVCVFVCVVTTAMCIIRGVCLLLSIYISSFFLSLSLSVLSLLVIIQLAGDAIDELFGRRTGRAG